MHLEMNAERSLWHCLHWRDSGVLDASERLRLGLFHGQQILTDRLRLTLASALDCQALQGGEHIVHSNLLFILLLSLRLSIQHDYLSYTIDVTRLARSWLIDFNACLLSQILFWTNIYYKIIKIWIGVNIWYLQLGIQIFTNHSLKCFLIQSVNS